MKKLLNNKLSIILCLCILFSLTLIGCGNNNSNSNSNNTKETEAIEKDLPDITVNVGSLKGPTSMGLVNLMADNEANKSICKYNFNVYTQADEIVTAIVKKELDIATIPANLASILYNKTEKGITVLDVNTLGVLYIVGGDDSIKSISDLKGKTLYLTGKGTSPDYVLQYLLKANGLSTDDVTLEYKSEATEVATVLASDSSAIGLLPQPFVTTAMMNNENLKLLVDMTEQWKNATNENLVTGVTIVRNEFLEQYPDVVNEFIIEHIASVEYGKENIDETCDRIEKYVEIKAAVAKKAYDYCNIVCLTNSEMKSALETYLNALYEYLPTSVGGSLPEENFYYTNFEE